MKKGVTLFALLFIISIIIIGGILASALSETEGVQKAYKCFNDQITNKTCSKLSTEEKVFSLLTSGKCKTELLNESKLDSNNNTCWSKKPNEACDLEMTSKAALALDNAGSDPSLALNWISSKKGVSTDLNWYLELDSNRPLTCSIGYENPIPGGSNEYQEYSFNIDTNKKIDQDAGPCLSLVNNDYWFKISNTCYEKKFEISCNESIVSTLLYRELDSTTYHVSEDTHSGEKTTEKIDSYCLLKGTSCDYPGTLWGSTALSILDGNFTEFLPYLTTSYSKFLSTFPEPFLYILTGKVEYKTQLLNKQVLNEYWSITGGRGKFYDTALALLPFQGGSENPAQKENSKSWLLQSDVQGSDGCWDNSNLVSTGFLLYSLWPKNIGGSNGDGGDIYCTDFQSDGYECINSSATCSGDFYPQYQCGEGQTCCAPDNGGGSGLSECETKGYTCGFTSDCTGQTLDYDCGAGSIQVCCDSNQNPPTTCSDLKGEVCSINEECSDIGNAKSTDDLNYGEICCTGSASCVPKQEDPTSTCVDNFGTCQSSCDSGQEANSDYTCSTSTDLCCMDSPSPTKSYWWIWVLFFLVILVVVGIIYREKIKEILQKIKAKKGRNNGNPSGSGPRGMPPRFPPGYSRTPQFRPSPPRRIVQESRPPQRFSPKQKSPKELDEVLKKLKEIGK